MTLSELKSLVLCNLNLSIYVYVFVCMYIIYVLCPSASLSIRLSIHPFVCLSVHSSVCLYVCLSYGVDNLWISSGVEHGQAEFFCVLGSFAGGDEDGQSLGTDVVDISPVSNGDLGTFQMTPRRTKTIEQNTCAGKYKHPFEDDKSKTRQDNYLETEI